MAEQLRNLIISGSLTPGSLLRQQELAERLGVSRTPLREALQALEQEGLVESDGSGPSRVADLDDRSIRQCMAAREVLDGLVARIWCEEGLPRALHETLTALLEEIGSAADRGDLKAAQIASTEFHLALLASLRNRWLEQFATLVRLSAAATFERLQNHPVQLRKSIEALRQTLRLIDARDADGAEAVARAQVRAQLQHWESGTSP